LATSSKAPRAPGSSEALAEQLNQAQLKNYFAGLPPASRKILQELRDLVRAAAAGATDSFSYGTPAVKLRGQLLVTYTSMKRTVTLAPIAASIDRATELKGFRTSKDAVQFPFTKPLPAALIKRLVKARIAELQKNRKAGADE
jgi:uncharacterized protein YdhG (YjbR/CyaY superfamily)